MDNESKLKVNLATYKKILNMLLFETNIQIGNDVFTIPILEYSVSNSLAERSELFKTWFYVKQNGVFIDPSSETLEKLVQASILLSTLTGFEDDVLYSHIYPTNFTTLPFANNGIRTDIDTLELAIVEEFREDSYRDALKVGTAGIVAGAGYLAIAAAPLTGGASLGVWLAVAGVVSVGAAAISGIATLVEHFADKSVAKTLLVSLGQAAAWLDYAEFYHTELVATIQSATGNTHTNNLIELLSNATLNFDDLADLNLRMMHYYVATYAAQQSYEVLLEITKIENISDLNEDEFSAALTAVSALYNHLPNPIGTFASAAVDSVGALLAIYSAFDNVTDVPDHVLLDAENQAREAAFQMGLYRAYAEFSEIDGFLQTIDNEYFLHEMAAFFDVGLYSQGAPVFDSPGLFDVSRGAAFEFSDWFSDPQGDAISFRVTSAAEQIVLSVDGAGFRISDTAESGVFHINVVAIDATGRETPAIVQMRLPSIDPVFTAPVDLEGKADMAIQAAGFFSDQGAGPLTYAIVSGPAGARIDTSGQITFDARLTKGEHQIEIRATNRFGDAVSGVITATVVNSAPEVVSEIPDIPIDIVWPGDGEVEIQESFFAPFFMDIDPGDDLEFSLFRAPSAEFDPASGTNVVTDLGLNISSHNGVLRFTPDSKDFYVVARDEDGATVRTAANVNWHPQTLSLGLVTTYAIRNREGALIALETDQAQRAWSINNDFDIVSQRLADELIVLPIGIADFRGVTVTGFDPDIYSGQYYDIDPGLLTASGIPASSIIQTPHGYANENGDRLGLTYLFAPNDRYSQNPTAILVPLEDAGSGGEISISYEDGPGRHSISSYDWQVLEFHVAEPSAFHMGGVYGDRLVDTQGADLMLSLAGNDTILAGRDADRLDTGSGSDVITLQGTTTFGPGQVAFNVSSGTQAGTQVRINLEGLLRVEAVTDGGAGADIVQLSGTGDAFFLHDTYSGFHSSVTLTEDHYGNQNAARFANIEEIRGMGGDDVIDLTSPDYSLAGVAMSIEGGEGNDVIWGSDADEIISGGNGNDTLFGGTGTDLITGGAGADVFEFTRTSTNTSVRDFDVSEGDTLLFYNADGATFDASSLALTATGIRISYTDTNSGTQHDLNIALAPSATEFTATLSDIQSKLDIL